MRPITLKVPAGGSVDFAAVGNYVRLKSAVVPITIEAPDNNEKADFEAGDDAVLTPFKKLSVYHADAAEQTITLYIGNGTRQSSSKVGGTIVAKPTQAGGATTHAAVAVGVVSAQIVAANPNREYLFVQNRDPVATIYININGAAVTLGPGGNGIAIPPGGYYESTSAWVSLAAVTAIGTAATNNILVVEG